MIPATKIIIGFSEHPQHQQPREFVGPTCFADAQAYLTRLAIWTPRDLLGYFKTDFEIEWADGEKYDGRLDIKAINSDGADHRLGHHIRQFVTFYGGLLTPETLPKHITPEQYDVIIERNKVNPVTTRWWLDNYELPQ
jgi:hypothetical protein